MSGAAGSIALLTLGTFHGVNPAMGWLFAVALGLQEQDRRAVWRALLPLGVGHALAVIAALAVAAALGLVIPLRILRWLVGAILLTFGVWRTVRHRHPRFGGMRVGARDLVIWSFLMASAHGAGLMVVPLVLDQGTAVPAMPHMRSMPQAHAHAQASRAGEADTGQQPVRHGGAAVPGAGSSGAEQAGAMHADLMSMPAGLGATLLHTLGYLLATGLIAFIVFERTGIGILRRAWVNLDLVWAGTLIVTGLLSLVL